MFLKRLVGPVLQGSRILKKAMSKVGKYSLMGPMVQDFVFLGALVLVVATDI